MQREELRVCGEEWTRKQSWCRGVRPRGRFGRSGGSPAVGLSKAPCWRRHHCWALRVQWALAGPGGRGRGEEGKSRGNRLCAKTGGQSEHDAFENLPLEPSLPFRVWV